MTKDEALEAIATARNRNSSWDHSQAEIREILDQIDPEPDQLWDLMRAVNWLYSLTTDGELWTIQQGGNEPFHGRGLDTLKAKLIELATPPKPTTVMVELPTSEVEYMASRDSIQCGSVRTISNACKAALAKLEQQQ